MKDYDEKFSSTGDLAEFYDFLSNKEGRTKANIWYLFQIFSSVFPYLIFSVFWRLIMFKTYLKIALRNIKKNKGFSVINIVGLALGMACFILIFLYVQNELSYDNFHESADRIYRVQRRMGSNYMRANASVITYGPLASALVSTYPEVINAVRIEHRDAYDLAIKYKNTHFYDRGFYVDKSFFDIFSYDFTRGDAKTALVDPFSIVITEELARKYFGDEEPFGKTLTIVEDRSYDAKITGIIKKVPGNSHLQFDFVLSMTSLNTIYETESFGQDWRGYDFLTYLELRNDADYKDLEAKLPALIETFEKRQNDSYYLMPVKDIHLKSHDNFEISENSDIQNIYILSLVAYIILIIACINYTNLSTAKALKRSKEVGVRKVVGASRKQLILQFLYESFILSAIALVLAVFIAAALLPAFNDFTNREILLNPLESVAVLPAMIALIVIVGIFSGIYPALFMTSFQPVDVLSRKYSRSSRRSGLRNTFVAFQFCISIMLITGTIIIGRQLKYIKSTDIGYDREHILAMQLRDEKISDNLAQLKKELLKNPAIPYVSSSSHIPNRITWGGVFQSKNDERVFIRNGTVDYDYVDLFDVKIIEGRNLSREFASDKNGAFLLNETAVKRLGWESPLGRECNHRGKTGKVVGIIKDFHFHSLHRTIEPLYLFLDPDMVRVMFVKIQPTHIQSSIKYIRETYESFNPEHPFNYFFLDDSFNDMYKSEQQFGKIVMSFSTIAIFIACLGLLGLISFSAEIRTKEIGIRKVLGASVPNLFNLITKEFLRLIGIAALVAWLVAYFSLKTWLQNFAYRINLGWDAFLLSGLIVVFVALFTVSYQSIKAATANPVDSLRYE